MIEEEAVETRRRRKVRRLPRNYYSSKLMSPEDRAELRRAGKVVGLGDEIALMRMRLKRAAEDQEDMELISLGLERLARAVGMEYKVSGKKDPSLAERVVASIRQFEDQLGIPEEKRGPAFWPPE